LNHLEGHLQPSSAEETIECPQCGSASLERVQRRLLDRLASLFRPLRRYRCRKLGCEWEGNLAVGSLDSRGAPAE